MKRIVANWKMQLGVQESVALARAIVTVAGRLTRVPDLVLAPSFVALPAVRDVIAGSHLRLAAQDISGYARGHYTGQVAAAMVQEVGATVVLLGHSERRLFAGETDSLIGQKLLQAYRVGLEPILCVGEPLDVREAQQTMHYLEQQLVGALQGLHLAPTSTLTIAYEPIWAIASGARPSVSEVCAVLAQLRAMATQQGLRHVRMLYGGSVDSHSIADLLRASEVDGVLVGTASEDRLSFTHLLQQAATVV